ncbi:MAG: TetR/AcrR family transcriptional regulator [Gracilibacteraceae bacterium]|nr:TetR/AcrR family transcriptional regulator [Gracilibacteraceae bacterium]
MLQSRDVIASAAKQFGSNSLSAPLCGLIRWEPVAWLLPTVQLCSASLFRWVGAQQSRPALTPQTGGEIMGRQSKKEPRARQDIKNALLALLKDLSYAEIRVVDLLKAAGYSKGAFYSHFKSKDDCMKAIVDDEVIRYIDCFVPSFAEPNLRSKEARAVTYDTYLACFRHVYDRKEFYYVILSEDSIHKYYVYFLLMIRQRSSKHFLINSDLAELFVFYTVHVFLGVIEYWCKHDFKFTPEELAAQVVKLNTIDQTKITLV